MMITFNELNGKQQQIPIDSIKSVKIECDQNTGCGVYLKTTTNTVVLVKTDYFSPSDRFDSVFVTKSPIDVLNQWLDSKFKKP